MKKIIYISIAAVFGLTSLNSAEATVLTPNASKENVRPNMVSVSQTGESISEENQPLKRPRSPLTEELKILPSSKRRRTDEPAAKGEKPNPILLIVQKSFPEGQPFHPIGGRWITMKLSYCGAQCSMVRHIPLLSV